MIVGNLAGGISYFSSDSIFNDTTILYNNNLNKNLFQYILIQIKIKLTSAQHLMEKRSKFII